MVSMVWYGSDMDLSNLFIYVWVLLHHMQNILLHRELITLSEMFQPLALAEVFIQQTQLHLTKKTWAHLPAFFFVWRSCIFAVSGMP